MRVVVLLGVTIVLLIPLGALAQKAPEQSLELAEASFRQQHYRDTIVVVHALLYPSPRLDSIHEIHRAREILGASYWQVKELENAKENWKYLLIARPSFQLDEFYYPMEMRTFFESIRTTLIRQGVIGKAANEPRDKPLPRVLKITEVIERHSRATAFIPFGVGQFNNGSDAWGWFFLSTETTALATSVGTSFAYQFLPTTGSPFTYTKGMQGAAKALYWTSLISGAVFTGLATWGIIDANIRHEPIRVVRIERTLEPVHTVDQRTPQPQKALLKNPPAAGGSQ
jgi:hypothetical protein